MMLVPTLQRMVDYTFAKDFWDNHQKNQEDLDRQNECELPAMARIHTHWDAAIQGMWRWSSVVQKRDT